MFNAFLSYLRDYKAKDSPQSQTYLNKEHDKMNLLIEEITEKAVDDF